MGANQLDDLEKHINYVFSNKELLRQALAHPSACSNLSEKPNNQRLEFLGDSVLGSVLAAWLFLQFPQEHEGELSKKKAMLARGKHLAEIAKSINLESFINASKSEFLTSGGFRDSLLEDALESLIGAVFLDSNYKEAERIILDWVPMFLKTLAVDQSEFNPKGRLQELLQAKSRTCRIAYRVVKESGPDHKKSFLIEVAYNGSPLAQASGASKRLAEENAAREALNSI